MQTSARRRNIEATGRGVVRWLPWIAELLQAMGLLGELPHGAAVPGLRADWPVQIRQNLYGDHRWHVVANSGVWGNSGFQTAEAATRFAQLVVIGDDGTEYRRNAKDPEKELDAYIESVRRAAARRADTEAGMERRPRRHIPDLPSGLPVEELRRQLMDRYGDRLALPVAERIAHLARHYDQLIEEIDRRYAMGHIRKVVELEAEAEPLRRELESLHEEYDQGGEEEKELDLTASIEEAFAKAHEDYLRGAFGEHGEVRKRRKLSHPPGHWHGTPEEQEQFLETFTTEQEYARNLREQLAEAAERAGLPVQDITATDEQLREYAAEAWRDRVGRIEQLREARKRGGEDEVARVRRLLREQQRRRPNPLSLKEVAWVDEEAKANAILSNKYREKGYQMGIPRFHEGAAHAYSTMARKFHPANVHPYDRQAAAWMAEMPPEFDPLRRNPIAPELAGRDELRFRPGDIKATVSDGVMQGGDEEEVILQYVVIYLWVDLAALNRVVPPERLALFLKYHTPFTHPDRFWDDREGRTWIRVGMFTMAEMKNEPGLLQIGVADVALEFRNLGLGIYLYSVGVDEAAKRELPMASLPYERTEEADAVWDSRRFRSYAHVEDELRKGAHPYLPWDAEFQTAWLQTSAGERDNPGRKKRAKKKRKKPRSIPARRPAKKKAKAPKKKPKADPKAHLRAVTPEQQAKAAQMFAELKEKRLEVEKQRAIDPETKAEGFVLVAVDHNPAWYSEFVSRRAYVDPKKHRAKKKPRTPGYRDKVFAALQRIIDGRPYPSEDWIGWELLALETEAEREEREQLARMGIDPDDPSYQEYLRQRRAEAEDDEVPF